MDTYLKSDKQNLNFHILLNKRIKMNMKMHYNVNINLYLYIHIYFFLTYINQQLDIWISFWFFWIFDYFFFF